MLYISLYFIYKGYKEGYFQSPWKNVLDPHLVPHVMVRNQQQGLSKKLIYFLIALWCWLTLAVAGPAFYKTTVETASQQKALVVVLDMSPAMTEQKLFTAQLKLFDLLKQQKETWIGFIITDQYAYTALPLTQDVSLFQNIVPTLSRKVIPIIGSNPASGIKTAIQLLQQSGFNSGQILLITGGLIEEKSLLQAISKSPYPVSILGIGTNDKVPANLDKGTFWEKSEGVPYLTTLDADILSQKARFSYNTLDSSDLSYLLPYQETNHIKKEDETIKIYQDMGIYMLIPALLLIAFLFKPGLLWVLLFIVCLSASDVHAGSPFLRAEQEIYNTQMKAVQAYRNGQYEQAAQLFLQNASANDFYNAGNAFANLGQIDKAIEAYEKALSLNPKHMDAQFNLEYLKKQQPPPPKQNNENENNENQSQDPSDENQSSSMNQANSSEGEKEQQQDNQQQSSEQSSLSQSEIKKNETQKQESAQQNSQKQQNQQEQNPQETNSQIEPQNAESSGQKETQPISQDMQQQQEWLDRVETDPGRILRYRLYRQYKEQIQ